MDTNDFKTLCQQLLATQPHQRPSLVEEGIHHSKGELQCLQKFAPLLQSPRGDHSPRIRPPSCMLPPMPY